MGKKVYSARAAIHGGWAIVLFAAPTGTCCISALKLSCFCLTRLRQMVLTVEGYLLIMWIHLGVLGLPLVYHVKITWRRCLEETFIVFHIHIELQQALQKRHPSSLDVGSRRDNSKRALATSNKPAFNK